MQIQNSITNSVSNTIGTESSKVIGVLQWYLYGVQVHMVQLCHWHQVIHLLNWH